MAEDEREVFKETNYGGDAYLHGEEWVILQFGLAKN